MSRRPFEICEKYAYSRKRFATRIVSYRTTFEDTEKQIFNAAHKLRSAALHQNIDELEQARFRTVSIAFSGISQRINCPRVTNPYVADSQSFTERKCSDG